MIELDKQSHDQGHVYVLTMVDGENRWNTTFTRAFDKALDEVEASDGPAALVTASNNPKFFSNGLDLDWVMAPADHPEGGDREVFGLEYMALLGRLITFPVPTLCAVNGHGFGAGFMIALAHDVRIMREDRGYLCANELEIGLTVPEPEVGLFRHKLSASAFHQTILLARRWTAPAAFEAGFVEATVPLDQVLSATVERAAALAPLATNRSNYQWQKQAMYGENSVLNQPYGPAHVLKHASLFMTGGGSAQD